MLDVPFYLNDGDGQRCYQVGMRGAIKYFLGKDISAEEADVLTGRKENKWTFATQIVTVMHDMGLDVKLYCKDSIEPLLEPEKTLRETMGNEVYDRDIAKWMDLPVIADSVRRTLEYGLFEQKVLTLEELEDHMKENHVPLVNVNWRVLVGREGFSGHFLTIVGFDNDHVYAHQPGLANPTPSWRIPKDLFLKAWSATGSDNEVVLVLGKMK